MSQQQEKQPSYGILIFHFVFLISIFLVTVLLINNFLNLPRSLIIGLAIIIGIATIIIAVLNFIKIRKLLSNKPEKD